MSSGSDDHEYCHPEEHERMMKQHQKMMGNMTPEQMKQMPMGGGQMPQQMKNGQMPMNNQGHSH
jgi:hypothetical protein